MWYLYLDESGDLGFDFVNKKPSKYFTISVLVLKGVDNNRKIIKSVKTTLRRKFDNDNAEIKGSATPISIKKYLYERVKNIDFDIYSLTLNKIRLFDQLRKDKERVYNYIARLVLDKIPFSDANIRIEIVVDKSKTRDNIRNFNEYIIRQIKSEFDPKIPIDIYHRDSKQAMGLQLVDVLCWGVFKKYEKKDIEWYLVFKDKIRCDEQYL